MGVIRVSPIGQGVGSWSVLWFAAAVTWVAYSQRLVPTWLYVYGSMRAERGRMRSWATASACAITWPLFLRQYRAWHRRSWVDDLEEELRATR